MLLEISIKNFVIIEQEIITFHSGLNIITGETGSGKSLLIDALTCLTGGRFSKEDIRSGTSKASIEAIFAMEEESPIKNILDEYGIGPEEDHSLLISREVNTSGKSVSRINGQIVTLSMLRNITQHIFDIVGQNEHQQLFNPSKHIDFIDNFGGEAVKSLKKELQAALEDLRTLEKKLESLCGNVNERERKLDLIQFQLKDIDSADLKPNEDMELANKRLILMNSERLFKNVSQAYVKMFKGEAGGKAVVDSLTGCAHTFAELSEIDGNLAKFKNIVENALYQLEDIKNELRQYRDSVEFNDAEIDNIEERIDSINKLKRKYGSSIDEILAYRQSILDEYDALINSEKIALELEGQIEAAKAQYFFQARRLSELRSTAAARLEKLVEQELQDLNMQGAKFIIQTQQDTSIISPRGIDKVEFMLSPNPGEAAKSLSKTASGGEMSRVMLAIKNALSATTRVPCVIFDEVDAGIGGLTAGAVGLKIKSISKGAQTICITHLPQIACYADNHIHVDKTIENDKTYSKAKILGKEERIIEIARMLGGSEDLKSSLAHAKQLIKNKQLP